MDYLGWVVTRSDVNEVDTILESRTVKSIEWADRPGQQFEITKMEMVLITC